MNSSRKWLEAELAAFEKTLPRGTLILDAGAGDQVYRRLFAEHEYESADFELVDKEYAKSNYVCDLMNIPVEDERFDAVFSTQVFEHLPEPNAVMEELFRVLKPGGHLFLSAPLYYEEHEKPYDFYRYTQFGLTHILNKSGFEIVALNWMEGYLSTVAHQLKMMNQHLPISPIKLGSSFSSVILSALLIPLKILNLLIIPLARRSDVHFKYTAGGHPINYVITAKKPSI